MIELLNVSKTYKTDNAEIFAVKDASLCIGDGEIHGIIGKSGAGKSTLIRCINVLERPDSGEVFYNGRNLLLLNNKELREKRKKISMIFQHFNLFTTYNVYNNILFPLKNSTMRKSEKDYRVKELLKLVELEDRSLSYPSQLSGGEKQRVAIARALANNPDVLLCDEATSSLDPKTTESILVLLKNLSVKLNLTIILITHEMSVIKQICDKVSIMEKGQIVESGSTIEVITNPKNITTKTIIDSDSNINNIVEQIKSKKEFIQLKNLKYIAKISYIGNIKTGELILELHSKFNVSLDIIAGNIEIINSIMVGKIVAIFSGEKENVYSAINYLDKILLKIEVISYD